MKNAKAKRAIVAAGVASCLLLANAAWAESNAPTNDPGIDWLGAAYDPLASGHKLSGSLTIVYDKEPDFSCSLGSRINKMYINITVGQNASFAPFTTSYSEPGGFCMGRQEFAQAGAILRLVGDKVIPFFFDCTAGCPGFKIKSITDYQYTTGRVGDRELPSDEHSGGLSATFTLAVR